jgi:uncharacterized membrane protein
VVGVTFLAASVEMVEALTLVLAAGVARGWRSALVGAGAALILLVAVVGLFGLAILRAVPMEALRIVLGMFLLLFGLKWLKKAILRQAGRKPVHQEDAIFAREVQGLSTAPAARGGLDGEGFATAFNGTLLEGLEVALILVALGSSTGQLGAAAVGAVAALVLVGSAGFLLRAPLSRVPENLLKFVVGLMLTSFGTFWAGEGLGVSWPWADGSVIALLALYVLVAAGAVWRLSTPAKGVSLSGRAP